MTKTKARCGARLGVLFAFTAKSRELALVGLLLLAGAPAGADTFTPSHSCFKPHKPYQFRDQWALDQFKLEVERYKQCIADFVEEQNEEIQKHQEAAEETIEEWNNFVNYELR